MFPSKSCTLRMLFRCGSHSLIMCLRHFPAHPCYGSLLKLIKTYVDVQWFSQLACGSEEEFLLQYPDQMLIPRQPATGAELYFPAQQGHGASHKNPRACSEQGHQSEGLIIDKRS